MKKRLFITMIIFVNLLILAACTDTSEPEPKNNNNETNHLNEEDANSLTNDHDTNSINENFDGDVENESSPEIVLENDAFKIFEPAPESDVNGDFIVRGLARVFEGSIIYEFEDGHFMIDEGFTTASEAAPEWGEFEFTVKLDDIE